MSDNDDFNYKVGRNKPPLETRFKPHTSGNPNGRPKGRHKITSIEELLDSPSIITKNGKSIRTDTRTALLLLVKQMAPQGKMQAIKMLEPYLSPPQPSKEDELVKKYNESEVAIHFVNGPRNPYKKPPDDEAT